MASVDVERSCSRRCARRPCRGWGGSGFPAWRLGARRAVPPVHMVPLMPISHLGTAALNDMNATFMSPGQHECGIHVVIRIRGTGIAAYEAKYPG